jgi:predicted TIM-barrel fold metal-dependent hydrolase
VRTIGTKAVEVIDAHTHLSAKTCGQVIEIMDRCGIDVMIDVSPNGERELEGLLRAFSMHPGRLFACCGIDPVGFSGRRWSGRACEALERSARAGAVGVKFDKSWGLQNKDERGTIIPIDHPDLEPVYEAAGRLAVPVLFHTADPRAFFDPIDDRNERSEELALNPDWSFEDRRAFPDWWRLLRKIEKVISRHRECTFVGVHFGCAAEEPLWVADVLRDHPRYFVDIAARVGELGRHRTNDVRSVFLEHSERIMFGTDLGVQEEITLGAPQGFQPILDDVERFYRSHWRWLETAERGIPHPTPIQGRWTVDAVDLPGEVLAGLYGGNARRVFSRIGERFGGRHSATG